MTEPTFIGIGAQKCAMTWIYDVLSKHPQVLVSTNKMINSFTNEFVNDIQWYLKQFSADASPGKTIGEFWTTYFNNPQAPVRIKNVFPNIKNILSLRNPVDRLMSNHKHEIRVGNLPAQISVLGQVSKIILFILTRVYTQHTWSAGLNISL